VMEFDVVPSKKKKKCVYMNIHYYVTKPQLLRELLNWIIVIKEFLKQLIHCCLYERLVLLTGLNAYINY
jgi:hypothetical protein